MALRRQSPQVELVAAQKRLDEQQASLARSRRIVERADAEKDAIASRENAGEISTEEAAKTFADVAEQERRHRGEVDRLGRVVRLLQAKIVELEGSVARGEYHQAVAVCRDQQQVAVSASKQFESTQRTLLDRMHRLERERGRADELLAAARELQPDDAADPALTDEPEWLDKSATDSLIAFQKAGPRRPVVTAERDSARRQRETAANENRELERVIASVVGDGGLMLETTIGNLLPSHLHDEARRRIAEGLEERRRSGAGRASLGMGRLR